MYNEVFEKYKKEVAASFALLFALLVIYAAATAISHIGKVRLYVRTVPSDAVITVAGKQIGNGDFYTDPGTYKITVSRTGFATTSSDVIVTDKKDQNVFATSLTPVSDDAKKWADKHQDDYTNNEQYGAMQAKQTGQYMQRQNPIIAQLPYQDPYYQIAYRTTDNQNITLTITTPSPRYRYAAVQKIRDMGYDPTDFVIDFVDYKNPLEAK
jgi:hypothetical protein